VRERDPNQDERPGEESEERVDVSGSKDGKGTAIIVLDSTWGVNSDDVPGDSCTVQDCCGAVVGSRYLRELADS